MLEIRSFTEADRTELRELFGRASEGVPPGSMWGHPRAEAAVFLEPYMDLEPESLFVATRDSVLIGYLTGCLDSSGFPGEDERVVDAVRRYRLILRPRAATFFVRSVLDLARAAMKREPTPETFDDVRWPSHLHLNVEPSSRGLGVGEGLMERWMDHLGAAGSPGCHLQTLTENMRAIRFFERTGFSKYGPTPPVPGFRYGGRRLHLQTMVWNPVP